MIILKTVEEIQKIRTASKYAMEILLHLGRLVKRGIKTIDLEIECEDAIKRLGT